MAVHNPTAKGLDANAHAHVGQHATVDTAQGLSEQAHGSPCLFVQGNHGSWGEVTCRNLDGVAEALAVQLPQEEKLAALHKRDQLQLSLAAGHLQALSVHGHCRCSRETLTVCYTLTRTLAKGDLTVA